MMSASVRGLSVLTLPAGALAAAVPACRPCTRRAASTLRSVTGSSAGGLSDAGPSAKRSTMPNGAAANLASGGIPPVDTLSGKLSALRSGRPEASLKSLGSSMVKAVFSASGALTCRLLTRASAWAPSAPPSIWGLRVSLADWRRMAAASLRGTGALNDSIIGRMGRQAAWAFSRSQLNSAENGSRTLKSKRFSTVLATPLGVATPLPNTICMREPEVNRRLQASVANDKGSRAASFSSPRPLRISARWAPSIKRTGIRSPTPSAVHHTLACTLAVVAGPLRNSTKNCSSSICS